jgi:SAM-dependent methyltransferase
MSHDNEKPSLDAQQQHWEGMFKSRPEMFGTDFSVPARAAAVEFRRVGARSVLELGGGQGRDTIWFATLGFHVHALDYAKAGIDAILSRAADADAEVSERIAATQHDVRQPLPFPDASFDACYSHMLFCMALTTAELEALSREILRVLRPGGICVYTVRNATDPDYGRGVHHGEGLYESQGFIVHYFDRAKVERIARGWELVSVDEFEEGKLPRRLYRVTMQKPSGR